MPGILALELMRLIFTVSICPTSSLYLSSSCSNSWCLLPCTSAPNSTCHIPCISSHTLGIFEVGGCIHSIYTCLFGSVVVCTCILLLSNWMVSNSWFTFQLVRTAACVIWAFTHHAQRSTLILVIS